MKGGVERALIANGLEVVDGLIQLPSGAKRVKIDVGLSDGAPNSAKWLNQDDEVVVFGFEALASNVDSLRQGLSQNPNRVSPALVGERFFPIHAALGNVNEPSTAQFYVVEGNNECSSLLVPHTFPVKRTEQVPIWSLRMFLDFFPFAQIPFIDHIKTDCQGTDLEVVKGIDPYLNRVLAITAEAEDDQYAESSNAATELSRYLRSRGFTPLATRRNLHPRAFVYRMRRDPAWILGILRGTHWLPVKGVTEDPTFIQLSEVKAIKDRTLFLYQVG